MIKKPAGPAKCVSCTEPRYGNTRWCVAHLPDRTLAQIGDEAEQWLEAGAP